MRLGERFRAGQQRLDLRAVLGRHSDGEESLVDAEPFREPGDRSLGRSGLAPLDLADVLLREASAGELDLRHARSDAERAHALAQACSACRRRGRRGRFAHSMSPMLTGVNLRSGRCALPREGDVHLPRLGQVTLAEIT